MLSYERNSFDPRSAINKYQLERVATTNPRHETSTNPNTPSSQLTVWHDIWRAQPLELETSFGERSLCVGLLRSVHFPREGGACPERHARGHDPRNVRIFATGYRIPRTFIHPTSARVNSGHRAASALWDRQPNLITQHRSSSACKMGGSPPPPSDPL